MQINIKTVNVNGLECLYNSPFSVLDLANYMGFNKNVIVIDYNGYILESNSWKQTFLNDNDCLEILSMAGGG
tara:strand:+ start:10344 stop:10559 length:216 start_codon:yes stop_codon:yes gene_type:complete